MKHLYKKLCNLTIEEAFLFKQNQIVMGMYRENQLVGCLKTIGSPIEVSKLCYQIEEIFPQELSDLKRFSKEKERIAYAHSSFGRRFLNNSKSDNYDYFDLDFNNVPKGEHSFFLNRNLWNIYPITIYLEKSNSFIAGLYRHTFLVGCFMFGKSLISIKKFASHIDTFFPEDIHQLNNYIEKNTAVTYYYSTDILI